MFCNLKEMNLVLNQSETVSSDENSAKFCKYNYIKYFQ
jgi:hypothetical protein